MWMVEREHNTDMHFLINVASDKKSWSSLLQSSIKDEVLAPTNTQAMQNLGLLR